MIYYYNLLLRLFIFQLSQNKIKLIYIKLAKNS